ncbi:MAG TPA: kynureninase [Saprospiraceae bacterium]|nr:kynureninase [Saprospiraceae bacterium]
MNSGQYRNQFHIPQVNGEDSIYLCGNSLGLQPKKVKEYVNAELEDWASLGVEGHLHARHPWLPYHEFLTKSMAKLVGGNQSEVVVMNSLTVNLHLLMASFYKPDKKRFKILVESDAFPSDRYAVASQAVWHGFNPDEAIILWKPEQGEYTLRTEGLKEILKNEGEQIALILLGGVNYYTGQYFNIPEITALGHEYGITMGWDLAHATGNVDLKLHDWNVDFAAWCSYKYLNSGPGSLGAVFIHDQHGQDLSIPRLSGWWGHNKETRFKMRDDFDPLPGAEGWQLSNPPILPLAAMRASLEIFDEAGIQNLRAISKINSQKMYDALTSTPHIKLITPADPEQRGCQLSLLVEENGRGVFDHLSKAGVIADWREPNVIRIAPVPLYNTSEDIDRFVSILGRA